MKQLVIGTIIFLSVALTYQIFNIGKKTKVAPSDMIEQENQAKMKTHLKSLTSGCDMTTFQGRLNCFKNKIAENRKNNASIPTQYFLIGKGFNLKLESKDLGDIIQIDRPLNISIKDCTAKSIFFDWNQSYFFIAPDSFDSGAICDSSKGRIAIVPSNLTNVQIQEFYKHMSKK